VILEGLVACWMMREGGRRGRFGELELVSATQVQRVKG